MVVAGKVGIVGQEHVAIRDVLAEGFLQGANRKSPAPVWTGMPSACAATEPLASATKHEKSWDCEKIGLLAVFIMTHPIWRVMWSSCFCVSASKTGSTTPPP